jgi:hypothetical protein
MKQTTRLSYVRLTPILGMMGICCALLMGCGSDSSSNNNANPILVANSGIQGMALLYQSIGSQNPTPLANAVITIQPQDGGLEITRQQTDGQGNFRFTLLPGKYRVVPLPDTLNHRTPTGDHQDVSVIAGKFTTITVGYVQETP